MMRGATYVLLLSTPMTSGEEKCEDGAEEGERKEILFDETSSHPPFKLSPVCFE